MPLTRADIAARSQTLIDGGYQLILASNAAVLDDLQRAPFGLGVTPLDFLAPSGESWSTADLMRVYNVLNAKAFGDKEIPLPNWVMIDLGLLPSAFLLVCLTAERAAAAIGDPRLPEAQRARSDLVLSAVLAEAQRLGHDGPVPVAGYCAAPTPRAGAWVGWSLCSAIPGLGATTKGIALEVYRARTLTGVAQFTDHGLRAHRSFGRMEILSAVLDLHPVPHTLVYRTEVYEEDATERPTEMLDCRDFARQRELQERIDSGAARYFVLSPGLIDDQVPILERT